MSSMLDTSSILENMAFTLYMVTCVSPPIREVYLQLYFMFSLTAKSTYVYV